MKSHEILQDSSQKYEWLSTTKEVEPHRLKLTNFYKIAMGT